MNVSRGPDLPTECPDQTGLIAFTAGRLSEPDMERLAGHVAACVRCETALRGLFGNPADSFEAELFRACAAPAPPTSGVAYHRMEAAALALCSGDTVSGDSGPLRSSDTGVEFRHLGSVGPYNLLEVIGRGGMGIVYRAMHGVLRRTVALKMLLPARHTRPEALARFRAEAEAVARLRHPNVVGIEHFDECPDGPYFSMELVEGETLARKLSRGALPFREAAAVVRSLAEGVAYAHTQGIVHRDLKPSNVLLAHDGTPKVTDFGLAKFLDEERTRLTRVGMVMGTPEYMSPEQAAGRVAEVGVGTDVYALGAILYECLAGRPPHTRAGQSKFLQLVRGTVVSPPSRYRADLPAALEAICLRCLEPLPADRYPTATALAEDLGGWLGGVPATHGRPARRRRVLRRTLMRRALAGGALAAAVAVVAVLLLAVKPATARRDAAAEVRTRDGKLLPFRVRLGDEKTKVTAAADGTITVSSWKLCLVEFTPDKVRAPYRFRARIRHEESNVGGEVGLYFSHAVVPGTFGDNHLFGQLTYDDIRSPADIMATAKNPPRLPKPPPQDNHSQLGVHVRTVGPVYVRPFLVHSLTGPTFPPCGRNGGCWRELTVTLRPDEVKATWDGQPFGKSLPSDEITSVFTSKLKTAQVTPPGVEPRYDTGGGLGLFVESGSASFSGVEVIPIGP
jgi:hypothetical protein